MPLLILFLLSFIQVDIFAQSTLDFKSIKSPRGVKLVYDEFKDTHTVTARNYYELEGSGICGGMGVYNMLSLSFVYSNNTLIPTIEVSHQSLVGQENKHFNLQKYINANEVDIYIKNANEPAQRYSFEWVGKEFEELIWGESLNKASKEIREFSNSRDVELFQFLLDHIKKDTYVKMRFKNTSNSATTDIEVPSRDIRTLSTMLEFYKTLSQKLQ
ncbi:MAG: hypothetical protein ACRCS8_05480 [Brevinema sp.]